VYFSVVTTYSGSIQKNPLPTYLVFYFTHYATIHYHYHYHYPDKKENIDFGG
jgi:hypothetical protein